MFTLLLDFLEHWIEVLNRLLIDPFWVEDSVTWSNNNIFHYLYASARSNHEHIT